MADCGRSLDRFSAIVIYLGLKALSLSPDLWAKYNTGDNILFVQSDFLRPQASALLKDLARLSPVAALADRFKPICTNPPAKTPTLEEFLKSDTAVPLVAVPVGYQVRNQYVVIDAADPRALGRHVGQRVEVVGRIDHCHVERPKYLKPYAFLNFGPFPHQTFTLVLWSSVFESFQSQGQDPASLLHRWVKVMGEISSYNGRAQMVIDSPSGLQLITEAEAMQYLGRGVARGAISFRSQARVDPATNRHPMSTPASTSPPRSVAGGQAGQSVQRAVVSPTNDAEILNRLYGTLAALPTTSGQAPAQGAAPKRATSALGRAIRAIADAVRRKRP